MTTVAAILETGRPGLRERAKAAQVARLRQEELEREQQRAELCEELRDYLSSMFGLDDGTIAGMRFDPRPTEKGLPVVTFKVEGIHFRARYDKVTTKIDSSNTIETIEIKFQFTLALQITSATVWLKMDSLADLGKALG
jgi:hypothetical protein